MKKHLLVSLLTSLIFITSFLTRSSFFGFKTRRKCRSVKSAEIISEHKEELTVATDSLAIEEPLPPAEEPQVTKKPHEKSRPKVQLIPKTARKQKTAKSVVKPETKPEEGQKPKSAIPQTIQPVRAPSASPATVEDRAHALFERCVDSTDKSLNWVNFCNQISDVLKQDAKYEGLAQAFKDIAPSKSIAYITYKLWWYTNKMPPKTKALYDKYSKSQLIHLINMRIALNDKPEKTVKP